MVDGLVAGTAREDLRLRERAPADNREYPRARGGRSSSVLRTNFHDLFRRAAEFVDKVLRGAKPADLPVEQPTGYNLVVNPIAAKALGLELSLTLLARADEVIE